MEAVIFDCDGTLVDSEPLARAAWSRVFERYGCGEVDITGVTGLGFPATHALLAARAPLPDAAETWSAFSGELFALLDDRLVPFDDAVETARALDAEAVPLGLASSSPRDRLDRTLLRSGVAQLFLATVAGDEVAHGKPAPDLFLAAAARLGVHPSRCVAVEDSGPGVAAARAAGMHVVGVRRSGSAPDALDDADDVVDALTSEAVGAALAGL